MHYKVSKYANIQSKSWKYAKNTFFYSLVITYKL